MSETRIRLVTRGDDSGSCHSANVAALEAFESGIMRNSSMMAPCSHFEEAAEMLGGLDGLCLGLHSTLNAEWDTAKWGSVLPPEQVPSLVDENGHLWRNPEVARENGAQDDEMMAELQAQLDLARSKGLDIAYLDTHMGWPRAGTPGLRDRIAALVEKEGLIHRYRVKRLPEDVGAHYDPNNRRITMLDDPDFANPVERFLARLEAAEPGTYIYVNHPGVDAEDMRQFGHEGLQDGQIAKERDWDRRCFTDRKVLDYCAANGVQPVRWTDVAE